MTALPRTRFGIPDAVPAEAVATWGADLQVDSTGAYAIVGADQDSAALARPGDCGRCARHQLVERVGRILWQVPGVREHIRRVRPGAPQEVIYNEDRLVIVVRRGVGKLYVQAWTTPEA